MTLRTRFVRSFRSATRAAAWQRTWDWLGTLASAVCMLHCLLVPIVLLALPANALSEDLHDVLHPVLALVLLPVTVAALWGSAARDACGHGHIGRRGLLVAGLVLVWMAQPAHLWLGPVAETVTTLAGSLCLIAGHQYSTVQPERNHGTY